MARTGVVNSMKDFYWDIRPKPDSARSSCACATRRSPWSARPRSPATCSRCAALLLQAPAAQPTEDDYLVYTYNRFQACRFGLDGDIVDPQTSRGRRSATTSSAPWRASSAHALDLRAR